MKKIIILFLLLPFTSSAQKLTNADVVHYLLARWEKMTIARTGVTVVFDSAFFSAAKFYTINGKIYGRKEGLERLSKINRDDLLFVFVVYYNELWNYKPNIGICTKSKQPKNLKKSYYQNACSAAFNIKKDHFIDSVYGSGNYALLIDDKLIEPSKVRSAFYSLRYEDIESIGTSVGYQIPFYGEDSRNGTIFISTKNKRE